MEITEELLYEAHQWSRFKRLRKRYWDRCYERYKNLVSLEKRLPSELIDPSYDCDKLFEIALDKSNYETRVLELEQLIKSKEKQEGFHYFEDIFSEGGDK